MKPYERMALDYQSSQKYPNDYDAFKAGFMAAKELYLEFLDNTIGHYDPCGPKDSCDSYCHEVKEASKIGEEEA